MMGDRTCKLMKTTIFLGYSYITANNIPSKTPQKDICHMLSGPYELTVRAEQAEVYAGI